jgi:hypothetical protein
MTLSNKILEIKLAFFTGLSYLIEKSASLFFNYPNNPGMPISEPSDPAKKAIVNYLSNLPVHLTTVPPLAVPRTLTEAFFGNYPLLMSIQRNFYEDPIQGYYNFYVLNYQNIFFLPDWLSEWIQINFEISVDASPLDTIRHALFVGLLSFLILLDFRMKLFWFLTINPYTRPWIYLIAITDWIFEIISGFVPVILGLDLSATIMLTFVGRLTDSLNHLVFTMPFLPSEGVPGRMVIKDELKDVIMFRYLPSLWYTHPIPDKLREFWYTKRQDILRFMETNYGQLKIDFLPDRILKEMYEQEQIKDSVMDNVNNLSTEVISQVSEPSIKLINFSFDYCLNLFDYVSNNINQIIT